MIDKKIQPIYVDPWYGLYRGDDMDVKDTYLIEPIISYYVLQILEPGEGRTVDGLIDLIEHIHHSSGGRRSSVTQLQMVDRFLRALTDLSDYDLVEYVEGEHSGSVWRTAVVDPDLPTFLERQAAKEGQADVIVGEGEHNGSTPGICPPTAS